MCIVSNIGDDWSRRWPKNPVNPWRDYPGINDIWASPTVTRDEFDALKKEMEELKKLLLAARHYDAATGQPDCSVEEKVDLIKKVAKMVGVDMADVFDKKDGD